MTQFDHDPGLGGGKWHDTATNEQQDDDSLDDIHFPVPFRLRISNDPHDTRRRYIGGYPGVAGLGILFIGASPVGILAEFFITAGRRGLRTGSRRH
jgi:hypothetical protein